MKNWFKENEEMTSAALLVFTIFIGACIGSWIITCLLVKLITLCFGWNFSWLIATGIWLLLWMIKKILK